MPKSDIINTKMPKKDLTKWNFELGKNATTGLTTIILKKYK